MPPCWPPSRRASCPVRSLPRRRAAPAPPGCCARWPELREPSFKNAQSRSMSTVFNFTFVPWFRSVAPYIHAHRGKTFVVAIAGELIAAGKLDTFAQDLALIHAMGIKVVLVHGFRPQVEEQLKAKGHASRFSHGMRITD